VAGITLPAAVWALPEDDALAVDDGLPAAESRPEGLGVDGLPLRPADADGLEGVALLELELELLCDDGDGMDADGEDDELDGMEGMELCDDCC
jgi:hypothetical protein